MLNYTTKNDCSKFETGNISVRGKLNKVAVISERLALASLFLLQGVEEHRYFFETKMVGGKYCLQYTERKD